MFVVYPRNHIFSEDTLINQTLSEQMDRDSCQVMKMTIGKDDERLSIYIRAVNKKKSGPVEARDVCRPKLSAKLVFPYLFEFLDVEELFKLRIVSRSWKFCISKVWHRVFSREMLKHLVVNECRKDIEKHYKITKVRKHIVEKFGIFALMIS